MVFNNIRPAVDRAAPLDERSEPSSFRSGGRGLNNDAAVKAVVWEKEFGDLHVVPTAVLRGVYSLSSLVMAQSKGLTLFWAHDLDAMLRWIRKTKQAMRS